MGVSVQSHMHYNWPPPRLRPTPRCCCWGKRGLTVFVSAVKRTECRLVLHLSTTAPHPRPHTRKIACSGEESQQFRVRRRRDDCSYLCILPSSKRCRTGFLMLESQLVHLTLMQIDRVSHASHEAAVGRGWKKRKGQRFLTQSFTLIECLAE